MTKYTKAGMHRIGLAIVQALKVGNREKAANLYDKAAEMNELRGDTAGAALQRGYAADCRKPAPTGKC